MFTTNQVCAAPVKVCIERTRSGEGQAIAGGWAIGTASTSRGGADGKAELTAQSVVVRWNLRTGAVERGFRIEPISVTSGGTLAVFPSPRGTRRSRTSLRVFAEALNSPKE